MPKILKGAQLTIVNQSVNLKDIRYLTNLRKESRSKKDHKNIFRKNNY